MLGRDIQGSIYWVPTLLDGRDTWDSKINTVPHVLTVTEIHSTGPKHTE